MIRVMVCGAYGKMGREVLRAVYNDEQLSVVGAADVNSDFCDVGDLIGEGKTGIVVGDNLQSVIDETKPQVMVDFTNPQSVMENIQTAIRNGVCPVVGTTGISEANINELREQCKKAKVNALISPNFSVGAILLMKLAQEAAKYFPQVEIIDLHHDQKLDAPSGTAIRMAELIAQQRGYLRQGNPDEVEKLEGARGCELSGIRLHSVRLPGCVAHHEVIFGGLGQTLTIRHDSISRESFMPGVILACKKVLTVDGLVFGLENIL
ncbi:MAG: 4-hydroxy-tetrahydrodipicolinate reductase [Veillonellales bacterium]